MGFKKGPKAPVPWWGADTKKCQSDSGNIETAHDKMFYKTSGKAGLAKKVSCK